MLDSNILKQKLAAIDGQDYAAYQSLLGTYEFSLFKLTIQQIPKDPYAPPHTGIYQIQVPRSDSRIIPLKIEQKRQNIACADFLIPLMRDLKKEHFKVLLLDKRNHVSEVIDIDVGTVDRVNPSVREILCMKLFVRVSS